MEQRNIKPSTDRKVPPPKEGHEGLLGRPKGGLLDEASITAFTQTETLSLVYSRLPTTTTTKQKQSKAETNSLIM